MTDNPPGAETPNGMTRAERDTLSAELREGSENIIVRILNLCLANDRLELANAELRGQLEAAQKALNESLEQLGDARAKLALEAENEVGLNELLLKTKSYAHAWKTSAEGVGQEIVKMRERALKADSALAEREVLLAALSEATSP